MNAPISANPALKDRRALLALALVSGVAALVYQTLWIRWFALLFGNTAYAASATLCAFFSGLAVGSVLFGRWASRSASPLRLYAWIEIAAAAAALAVPLVFSAYDQFYAALYQYWSVRPGTFVFIKFALALAAMLPPSVLLGGTIPALVAAQAEAGSRLSEGGGPLYAINTAGAVLGAALGALLLPDWIGIPATYGFGIACSLAVGAAAWRLAARRLSATAGRASTSPPLGAVATGTAARAAYGPLAIAFASGFGTLAFEVLLLHGLGQLFLHSAYTIGVVLMTVLAGLAIAAALTTRLARAGSVPALMSGALLAQALLLLCLPAILVGLQGEIDSIGLVRVLRSWGIAEFATSLMLASLVVLPGFLIGGLVFPLTFQLADEGPAGRRIGGLLAANTAGGIVGSLAASLVLLDRVGLWASMGWLGLGYGAAALLVRGNTTVRVLSAAGAAAVAIALFLGVVDPWTEPLVNLRPGAKLIAIEEGAHGVVSVVENSSGARRMKVDDQYQFGDSAHLVLYDRHGHIPLLLHPKPKKVVFVGSATGGVAASAVLHPVDRIDLVELVPEVHELAAAHFAETNRGVHSDPRVRLIHEDGRNHLRATGERYDVIVEDLFVPKRPSSAAMYTLDHYEEAKQRLSDDGIFCQWIPVYQHTEATFLVVAATFAEAFPGATMWRPHFKADLPIVGLVGTRGSGLSAAQVGQRTADLRQLGIEDRWVTDPDAIWVLYAGAVDALFEVAERPLPNSDAHPRLSFLTARQSPRVVRRYSAKGFPRLFAALTPALGEEDRVYPGRPMAGPLLGNLFLEANAAMSRGDNAAAGSAWKRMPDGFPRRLLREPDVTLSSVWPARI
jgi:spermidine synthase